MYSLKKLVSSDLDQTHILQTCKTLRELLDYLICMADMKLDTISGLD